AGSIIEVRPGTYTSSGTDYVIDFSRKASTGDPITLEAATPGTVTIANGDQSSWTIGAWINNASGLRLRNLTFRVTTTSGANVGADEMLIENSTRIEIDQCTFYEAGTMGISIRGGTPGQSSAAKDNWIINSTFRPSGSNPSAQVTGTSWTSDQYFGSRGSHWIYVGQVGDSSTSAGYDYYSGAERTVIANNVFTGTTAGYDVELGPEARTSYVVNNTFYGNKPGDLLGWSTEARYAGNGVLLFLNSPGASYATSNNVVVNNIFEALNGHAVAGGSSGAEVDNLVQNNLSYGLQDGAGYQDSASQDYMSYYESPSNSVFSTGTGNQPSANPLFPSPSAYNFQPQGGSPAIGRADPAYALPSDMNGVSRPAAPDLGALQH